MTNYRKKIVVSATSNPDPGGIQFARNMSGHLVAVQPQLTLSAEFDGDWASSKKLKADIEACVKSLWKCIEDEVLSRYADGSLCRDDERCDERCDDRDEDRKKNRFKNRFKKL